jgi:hypothetical protein
MNVEGNLDVSPAATEAGRLTGSPALRAVRVGSGSPVSPHHDSATAEVRSMNDVPRGGQHEALSIARAAVATDAGTNSMNRPDYLAMADGLLEGLRGLTNEQEQLAIGGIADAVWASPMNLDNDRTPQQRGRLVAVLVYDVVYLDPSRDMSTPAGRSITRFVKGLDSAGRGEARTLLKALCPEVNEVFVDRLSGAVRELLNTLSIGTSSTAKNTQYEKLVDAFQLILSNGQVSSDHVFYQTGVPRKLCIAIRKAIRLKGQEPLPSLETFAAQTGLPAELIRRELFVRPAQAALGNYLNRRRHEERR